MREYIKSKGLNTASAVLDGDALNKIIIEMLDKAVERAKANNRKTVKARDL
ncbi:MAG: histone-like protein [Promethearchaeota archaeon]